MQTNNKVETNNSLTTIAANLLFPLLEHSTKAPSRQHPKDFLRGDDDANNQSVGSNTDERTAKANINASGSYFDHCREHVL